MPPYLARDYDELEIYALFGRALPAKRKQAPYSLGKCFSFGVAFSFP